MRTLNQSFHLIPFSSRSSSVTRHIIASCTLWTFLADKEVACGNVSIDVPNVGGELSVAINVNTLVDLKGDHAEDAAYDLNSMSRDYRRIGDW
jgi:hypothetical protein